MGCYISKLKPATKESFKLWQDMGYTGTWEMHVADKQQNVGGTMFMCGDLGSHCADCNGFGDFLCDYPVGHGKTCDRPMCDYHGHEIAPELHYCESHYKMWGEFKASGGVDAALKNVIAFKTEK